MIGILGAMDVEIQGLMEQLDKADEKMIGDVKFVRGLLSGREVVVARCGIGKVNAAVCAQSMLLTYHPELIINVGVGGSLHPELQYAQIAVANALVQHDVDTTALGDPIGLVSTVNKVFFPCDEAAVRCIERTAKELGFMTKVGVIASGDQFIAGTEKKKFITENFQAICCEMEGGAIAQTCYLNQVPVAVIRSISDNADESSHEDYPQFMARAARQTTALMEKILPRL